MFKIIKLETYGIKGIKDKVSFQFLNETINFTKAEREASIKAIYGINGTGKTSFITAIDLYKKICSQNSYLIQETSLNNIRKIINKTSKGFGIKIYYMETTKKQVFSHEIQVNNKTETPFIELERFSRIIGKTLSSKENIILEIKEGSITNITKRRNESDIEKIIQQRLEKITTYTSSISIINDINFSNSLLKKYNKEEIKNMMNISNPLFYTLTSTHFFIQTIQVYLANSDAYDNSFINQNFEDKPLIKAERTISKTKIEQYIKQINRMTKFIKLFKPTIKNIDVEKKENENNYNCRLVIRYDNYSIDYEYESSGIKNLISLYSALDYASSGKISFIDEMDANINEIYLSILCDYFLKYSKGQLCFTTQNTSPMNILKNKRYAIDFINNDQEIVSWVKNGNNSLLKLYCAGMIPKIPFNIESFDFVEVFSEEA